MIGSHVIPRFYLEQFATKKRPKAKTGHLWIYSTNSPPRFGTAKSEGIENGYFGVRTSASKLDETLESQLAVLEDDANDVLVMAQNETFVWSSLYRQKLAMYAGLLYARARARRDATAWIAERASKELLRLLEDPEFLREMTNDYTVLAKQPVTLTVLKDAIERSAKEQAAPEGKRNFFLDELFPTANMIAGVLLHRRWQVWTASGNEEFITSDNPVITMMPIGENFASGFGFHQQGILVALPLNPASCLIMAAMARNFRVSMPQPLQKPMTFKFFACSRIHIVDQGHP